MTTLEENWEALGNQAKRDAAEILKTTPRSELRKMVEALMPPEAGGKVTEEELDLILNSAKAYAEKYKTQPIGDALVVGIMARAQARKISE